MKLLRNPFHNGKHRNEKCFCGSDKKLKRCHGEKYAITEEEYQNFMRTFEAWEASKAGQDYYVELQGTASYRGKIK